MREYVTDAVTLRKEPVGEADVTVTLYTERLGRVLARATSARKITSRLSAHLEPLTFLAARLVEKRGSGNGAVRFQVVDALARGRLRCSPRVLRLLEATTPEGEPDAALWSLLQSGGDVDLRAVLRAVGFDPRHAHCDRCRNEAITHFSLPDTAYLCTSCVEVWRRRGMRDDQLLGIAPPVYTEEH